jgi:hypothetical protein
MNTTLEYLELNRVHVTDDNVNLWCRALSFLRTNKDIKVFVVNLKRDVKESRVAAFRTDIAAMLQENASLESLRIQRYNAFKAENYVALITALQRGGKDLKASALWESCSLDWRRR